MSVKTIGVVVWRFQSAIIPSGIQKLINATRRASDEVCIVITTSPTRLTMGDALPIEIRMRMVRKAYPKARVLTIEDMKYSDKWIKAFDNLLSSNYPFDKVIIHVPNQYGSIIPCERSPEYEFHGKFEVEVHDIPGQELQVREPGKGSLANNEFYRQGIIEASAMPYPKVFPTVDMAIVDMSNKKILLAKKPMENRLRFPGGFVDPADETLEDAAIREIEEECGDIIVGGLQYVSSRRIMDWRYLNTRDKIHSTLFFGEYLGGEPKASDDISELKWVNLSELEQSSVEPEHQAFVEDLINFLNEITVKNATVNS